MAKNFVLSIGLALLLLIDFVMQSPVRNGLIPPPHQRMKYEHPPVRSTYQNSPRVDPEYVKKHHLDEAKEHYKQGVEVIYRSLSEGAGKAIESNLLATVHGIGCQPQVSTNLAYTSGRAGKTGLAICLDSSLYSVKNIVQHLRKSRTEPNNVNKTHDEFVEKIRNDRHKRRHDYHRWNEQASHIRELH